MRFMHDSTGTILATAFAATTLVAVGLLLGSAGWARERSPEPPVRTDFGARVSHHGLYVAEVVATGGPVGLGRSGDWTVRVRGADGDVVDGADVTAAARYYGDQEESRVIDVTPMPRADEVRLVRVRTDRAGWWSVKLTIRSRLGTDSLAFNLVIDDTPAPPRRWSDREMETLRSLWIGSLGPVPADPSNRYADDPAAVRLGHRLFFEPRLSSTGTVSCASCHEPDREFQDGTPLAAGVGRTDRRTMPIAGTAYAPFLFWDGRKDGLWAQALGPLESPVEHGGTRAQYAHVIAEHHAAEYEALFGPLPSLAGVPRVAGPVDDPEAAAAWRGLSDEQRDAVTGIFVNIGKAIAAYERRIQYGPSRFDRYVEALLETGSEPRGVLTAEELDGLRLFMGEANCIQCHNGPLFTNNEFHNTGVPAVRSLPPDRGRMGGTRQVLRDEFNCRSRWSDAGPSQCAELDFLMVDAPELERAFKVPPLRNVADRPPYMHAGQFATLTETLKHYDRAPRAPGGKTELERLKLNRRELRALEAYLRALSGGSDAPAELLSAPR